MIWQLAYPKVNSLRQRAHACFLDGYCSLYINLGSDIPTYLLDRSESLNPVHTQGPVNTKDCIVGPVNNAEVRTADLMQSKLQI